MGVNLRWHKVPSRDPGQESPWGCTSFHHCWRDCFSWLSPWNSNYQLEVPSFMRQLVVMILFVFLSLLVGFAFVWKYLYPCRWGAWWVPVPESILPVGDCAPQGLVLNPGKTEGLNPITNGSMVQGPAGRAILALFSRRREFAWVIMCPVVLTTLWSDTSMSTMRKLLLFVRLEKLQEVEEMASLVILLWALFHFLFFSFFVRTSACPTLPVPSPNLCFCTGNSLPSNKKKACSSLFIRNCLLLLFCFCLTYTHICAGQKYHAHIPKWPRWCLVIWCLLLGF